MAFYHCDQVGTPQTLSNELGECVWEIKQGTWGTALEINASDNLLEQTNIRFQGQYYDYETELHYNRYRYYEPFSARYVSKDPMGLMADYAWTDGNGSFLELKIQSINIQQIQ
nr:RHS repeat-associated core domain-containing protein [Acinetobacter wuhouensis]